jgi:uncharacterized protein YjbI with pentapeptide repeats
VADLKGADLSRAGLSWANLSGADLSRAHLREADLSGANLIGANLEAAYLGGADLYKANLSGARLGGTDLGGADLRATYLGRANLHKPNLRGTILDEAIFYETIFLEVDLETTIGLDNCEHRGPSTIDFQTLFRSGNLPISFLRGCGLPDNLIDYLPSFRGEAIQFYSCFISYSSKDQVFADRLHADLQNKAFDAGLRRMICRSAPRRGMRSTKLSVSETSCF